MEYNITAGSTRLFPGFKNSTIEKISLNKNNVNKNQEFDITKQCIPGSTYIEEDDLYSISILFKDIHNDKIDYFSTKNISYSDSFHYKGGETVSAAYIPLQIIKNSIITTHKSKLDLVKEIEKDLKNKKTPKFINISETISPFEDYKINCVVIIYSKENKKAWVDYIAHKEKFIQTKEKYPDLNLTSDEFDKIQENPHFKIDEYAEIKKENPHFKIDEYAEIKRQNPHFNIDENQNEKGKYLSLGAVKNIVKYGKEYLIIDKQCKFHKVKKENKSFAESYIKMKQNQNQNQKTFEKK